MLKKSVVSQDAEPEYELVITCLSDLLEASVVYQDIFQNGERRGWQKE